MRPIQILYIEEDEGEDISFDDIAKYYSSYKPLWLSHLIITSKGKLLKNRYDIKDEVSNKLIESLSKCV